MSSAAKACRGVEHVGLTVPDIEQATAFFAAALGAETIYDLIGKDDDAVGPGLDGMLGVDPKARITALRMLRLGESAGLELFEYAGVKQGEPVVPSNLGVQHIAFYVDDIQATATRIVEAGGRMLEGPVDMLGVEAGSGNYFWYFQPPWGGSLELVAIPSPQAYESTTELRRWHPPA
jgi:catechol 2,3-dioxygenase-like lactoylglutathione lyase family enzyme